MAKGYFVFIQTNGNKFCTTRTYTAKTTGGLDTAGGNVNRDRLKQVFGTRYTKWYDKLVEMQIALNGQFEVADTLPPGARIDVNP